MTDDPSLEHVPLLVTTCCTIVEERGLDIVGVYRVPGNSAAVSHLSDLVNTRGVDGFHDDHRWNDVNVVSSLLKSFFRKLPEPLFTTDLYSVFIEASKHEDPTVRLNTLKRLVHDLPEVNFETLKYVCQHLNRVSLHSEINKMEVKNLAIVFGPTLVRTADDNMLAMVTDMSQQCRIIESMLSNTEWFFNDEEHQGELPVNVQKMLEAGGARSVVISQTGNESLLLNNLQKLEEAGKVQSPNREVSAKDIVSGIISAANRKIQRSSGVKGHGQKKDSVDAGHIDLSRLPQRVDTPTRGMVANPGSRRNSESVIQSAMTIAAAVPQLMGNSGKDSTHTSATNIPSQISSELRLPFRQISASAENINRAVMAVSGEGLAAVAGTAATALSEAKFPIESYTGLEEAMGERVKKFEDETKAMLMRGNISGSGEFVNCY